ncbi:MAG: dockerin type I domain-containing protein [Pirellulaceae bacterium]
MRTFFGTRRWTTWQGTPHGRSNSRNATLGIESLESRRLLTAEGSPWPIDQSLDVSALIGTPSAIAKWGDGTQSSLSIASQPASGSIRIRFDYSYDTGNFFNTQLKKDLLQLAADLLVTRFSDSLSAITPSGSNSWTLSFTHPATGNLQSITNASIAANELLVFVGSRDLPAPGIAEGGFGGYASSGSPSWLQTVQARGQSGALASPPTDFGPWGGNLTFDPTVPWHFGATTEGLETTENDFLSVAAHEIAHLLGFGVASSWQTYVSGATFIGPQSILAHDAGGAIPLAASGAHWVNGTTDAGKETLMDPSLTKGTRKLPTRLDLAGLDDLGWQVIEPTVRVQGTHIYGDNGTFPVEIELTGSRIGLEKGNASAAITNAPPVFSARSPLSGTAQVPLNVVNLGSFTDAGFGIASLQPPRTETFGYRIDWGDGSSIDQGDATIDRLGSAGVLTAGSFDGNHTYLNPGSYTMTLTVTDDDGGTATQTVPVEISGVPKLILRLTPTSISENAGNGAVQLTIERSGFPVAQSLTVQLSSSDTSELVVPATVIIPANQTQVVVPLDVIDDTLLDGTQSVIVSAQAGSVIAPTVTLQVIDHETLSVTIAPSSIRENAGPGAALVTVTRSNTDRTQALMVTLSSSDISEAAVPTTLILPAFAASASTLVDAVDDDLLDGTQNVLLQADASGYVSGGASLAVEDFEAIRLEITPGNYSEAPGANQGSITLSVPFLVPSGGMVIQLSTSPATQIQLPGQVTIPAGSRSVLFPFQIVQDYVVEGTQSVRIQAQATGLQSAAVDLVFADDDLPIWQNPLLPTDIDGDGRVTPRDALLVINQLNLRGQGPLVPGVDPIAPPYLDASGNGLLEPLDALLVINYLNLQG